MSKRKRQRLKRSHLRPYSAAVVRVPRIANRDIINAYHERTASVTGRRDRVEPIANNTFTKVVPQTRGLQQPSEDYTIEHDTAGNPIKVKTPHPRSEIADKRKLSDVERLHLLWQSDWKQGIDDFHFVIRARSSTHVLKLFFSGSRYIWVYETDTYYKRSPVYNSLGAAELAFQLNIPYVEVRDKLLPSER